MVAGMQTTDHAQKGLQGLMLQEAEYYRSKV